MAWTPVIFPTTIWDTPEVSYSSNLSFFAVGFLSEEWFVTSANENDRWSKTLEVSNDWVPLSTGLSSWTRKSIPSGGWTKV